MGQRSHLLGLELTAPKIGEDPPAPPASFYSINDPRNGILLRKDLHASLGKGEIGFLMVRLYRNYFRTPSKLTYLDPKLWTRPH